MKRVLIRALMIGAIVDQLVAQTDFPGSVLLLPLVGPATAVDTPNPSGSVRDTPGGHPKGTGFAEWGYASDPFYAGAYGHGYQAQPSIIVLLPQVVARPPRVPVGAPEPIATPPTAIRSEIIEYHWPSSASDSSAATLTIKKMAGLNP